MLYTRKGDSGMTGTFSCDQRISKSSAIAEALGSLDEINSFLGICKYLSKKGDFSLPDGTFFAERIDEVQKNLFIVQAEVAGSEMSISEEKTKDIEKIIDDTEHELPPIKSFFISGGTELSSFFDIARTIARRAERRVVEVAEKKDAKISISTLGYLNRLSSLLYALARLSNHISGITEESPDYK